MEKMTIAEKIGDEYMQWEPHSKVFISAPTGSGKTYFVLHKLLPYVSQKKTENFVFGKPNHLKRTVGTGKFLASIGS